MITVSDSGAWSVPVAAFVGGLLATGLVLSVSAGGEGTGDLLLSGIAVNAICSAGVGMLLFVADDAALRSFTFWTLGSVGGANWPAVQVTVLGAVLPAVCATVLAARLDALLLGEAEAEAIGVPVAATRRTVVGLAALMVGTSVALCGMIGFVGLLAPHLVRRIAGPAHALVLPGSALLGAGLLLLADLLARTVAAPAELPIGVLTTLVGGPFLLWMLRRGRR